MNNIRPRSSAVDILISDYGTFLGIEPLAFDAENLLAFEINGIEITLLDLGEPAGILLKAFVQMPAEQLTPDLLLTLFSLNYTSTHQGMGSLMLDRAFGAWVWVDRLDPRGLTAATLHVALNRAAGHVAFWQNEMPELLRRLKADEPHDFAAAEHAFIRI